VTETDPASPNYREVIAVRRGDAATLLNAGVQYRAGHWTVSAYGRNLLDETYAVSRTQGTVATAGAPLSVGMAVRYDM
jgi:outer membrane receptor protein involved in Fe transport